MRDYSKVSPQIWAGQTGKLAARFLRSSITDALVVVSWLRVQVTSFGEESDLAWRLAALAAKIETHLVLSTGREVLGTKVNETAEGRAKIDAAIRALMAWALEHGEPWIIPGERRDGRQHAREGARDARRQHQCRGRPADGRGRAVGHHRP